MEKVEDKRVGELTDEDAILDGFPSREELINALKSHYRYVNDDSPAHVIVFRLVERFDKPVMSSDYAYEGNLPLEIAEKALRYLDLPGEDRKLIELFLKTGSLRKAARRLGGLDRRYLIRDALRRAYEELKRRGIMGAEALRLSRMLVPFPVLTPPDIRTGRSLKVPPWIILFKSFMNSSISNSSRKSTFAMKSYSP